MLTRVTPPAVEPVTLAQAKAHLRVNFADDDALVTALVGAARGACEKEVDRSFVTTAWQLGLDRFPWPEGPNRGYDPRVFEHPLVGASAPIRVPVARLIAVSSITYLDGTGTRQTLSPSAYTVEAGDGGRIVPAYGTTWPTHRTHPGSVLVSFTAGYGPLATDVPPHVVAAVLLTVGHLYENREAVVIGQTPVELTMGVKWLLSAENWGAYP